MRGRRTIVPVREVLRLFCLCVVLGLTFSPSILQWSLLSCYRCDCCWHAHPPVPAASAAPMQAVHSSLATLTTTTTTCQRSTRITTNAINNYHFYYQFCPPAPPRVSPCSASLRRSGPCGSTSPSGARACRTSCWRRLLGHACTLYLRGSARSTWWLHLTRWVSGSPGGGCLVKVGVHLVSCEQYGVLGLACELYPRGSARTTWWLHWTRWVPGSFALG